MGPGPTPTHIYNGEKSQQIFGIEREREREQGDDGVGRRIWQGITIATLY